LTTGDLSETSIILGTDDHNVRTTTDGKIQITTPNTANNVWEFGTDGTLTFPSGNLSIGNAFGSDSILGSTGTVVGVIAQGQNGAVGIQWIDNIENIGSTSTQTLVAAVIVNGPLASTTGTVQIVTGFVNTATTATTSFAEHTWTFGTDGGLTFPDGQSIIRSLNVTDGIPGLTLFAPERIYLGIASSSTSWSWDFRNYGQNDYSTDKKPAVMLPGGSVIEEDLTNQELNNGMAGPLSISSRDKLTLRTNNLDDSLTPEATYDWEFGTDGGLTVPGSIIPDADVVYDLGSPSKRFRDIYVSSSTIYIGTSTISVSETGQMLVNGNAATAKVEYFGTEGFGPRDAIFSAWIGSKLFFASPGKELRQAIYDLLPGNPLSLYNDTLGLVKFTINGSAADVINTLGYGGQDAIEIPVAELNTYTNFTPQLYLHDIYLPVKDKSATIANGTWTVTVSTTGTIVYPDSTEQSTAYNPNSLGLTWTIGSSGSSDYTFSGPGIFAGNTNDPVLYLYRGFTYKFNNTTGSSHPFAIRVSNGGAAYTTGVSGSQTGIQTFTVPMNAPSTLYYQCTIHSSMGNVINIV
jgi:hypothetical protein